MRKAALVSERTQTDSIHVFKCLPICCFLTAQLFCVFLLKHRYCYTGSLMSVGGILNLVTTEENEEFYIFIFFVFLFCK